MTATREITTTINPDKIDQENKNESTEELEQSLTEKCLLSVTNKNLANKLKNELLKDLKVLEDSNTCPPLLKSALTHFILTAEEDFRTKNRTHITIYEYHYNSDEIKLYTDCLTNVKNILNILKTRENEIDKTNEIDTAIQELTKIFNKISDKKDKYPNLHRYDLKQYKHDNSMKLALGILIFTLCAIVLITCLVLFPAANKAAAEAAKYAGEVSLSGSQFLLGAGTIFSFIGNLLSGMVISQSISNLRRAKYIEKNPQQKHQLGENIQQTPSFTEQPETSFDPNKGAVFNLKNSLKSFTRINLFADTKQSELVEAAYQPSWLLKN